MTNPINTPREQRTQSRHVQEIQTLEPTTQGSTSTAYEIKEQPVNENDNTAQEAWIGTDDTDISQGNISWGAIFAGVVTFLSIMVVFGLIATAMGLQGTSGLATGITTIIGLALAFAAAGYVAGALGVKAGLFHGFATWATSVISALILAGWLGASVIGGLGTIAGNTLDTMAQTAGNAVTVDTYEIENRTNTLDNQIAQQDIENAQQQAQDAATDASTDAATQVQDTYNEYSDEAAEGTWWTILGLTLGAVLSSLAGALGARSVINRRTEKQLVQA